MPVRAGGAGPEKTGLLTIRGFVVVARVPTLLGAGPGFRAAHGAGGHMARRPRRTHQASEDAADPEHRCEHEQLSERSSQELGPGRRNDEERIHEHDADHADTGDDGEGEQHAMSGHSRAQPDRPGPVSGAVLDLCVNERRHAPTSP